MFFVKEPAMVASWWATHLGQGATVVVVEEFCYFDVDAIEFGFHPADERNPVGASPMVRLFVAQLEQTPVRMPALGCHATRSTEDRRLSTNLSNFRPLWQRVRARRAISRSTITRGPRLFSATGRPKRRLVARLAVDRFTEQIGVPTVSCVLFDHVHHDESETEGPVSVHAERIETLVDG